MSKIFHGIVNRQSIEIKELLGIANGEQVEIVVKRVNRDPSDFDAGCIDTGVVRWDEIRKEMS